MAHYLTGCLRLQNRQEFLGLGKTTPGNPTWALFSSAACRLTPRSNINTRNPCHRNRFCAKKFPTSLQILHCNESSQCKFWRAGELTPWSLVPVSTKVRISLTNRRIYGRKFSKERKSNRKTFCVHSFVVFQNHIPHINWRFCDF